MASVNSERAGYVLANDEEMNRLSTQHYVIKDAMGGLLMVPVDHTTEGLRILDSGTADGTWISDLQSTMSSKTTFTGTDIDPSKFPSSSSPGTTFQVQDINGSWPAAWQNNFDIVHQRLTLAAAGPATKVAVHKLATLLKPGAWIQLIEPENVLDDKQGPAMHDFVRLMQDIFSVMGTSLNLGRDLAPMLHEEGFVDIQERVVILQMGPHNKNPDLGRQGAKSTAIACAGLVQFASISPPTDCSLPESRTP
ncbi:hypothetical protein OCU04_000197 [Sclerotinia nivalis]|uniref:Methyltransferase domain-containing protein n=1 Tax=Sclerotinia nivalis TaxID=352851 RepID=A0A9X0DN62_9HELO|nr:hypothetical protein OCU04_000197 [Sclerotinia nivalis]